MRIHAKRIEFSKKTYRLHVNMVVALILYCIILIFQLGIPVSFVFTAIFFGMMWTVDV
ncbi:hypothetical protein ANCCAN_10642 [Ancylostoma caninum]|uniref:Uncharacterized protein n=1 Tax=Ancylostoma caninum TaxID=29170 RepID=A0A368GI63_ANCCA|nr:hypothetical protein ANCCAN_10642 [Ancylostoma caninum]